MLTSVDTMRIFVDIYNTNTHTRFYNRKGSLETKKINQSLNEL